MPLTHYVIVRRDLPFGQICAQITHAAGESFFAFGNMRHVLQAQAAREGTYILDSPDGGRQDSGDADDDEPAQPDREGR